MTSLDERNPRRTTWHVDSTVDLSLSGEMTPTSHTVHAFHSSAQADTETSSAMNSALKDGMKLVAQAAYRVWDELYICKKPVRFFSCSLFSLIFV
jgi:hypothetical protein